MGCHQVSSQRPIDDGTMYIGVLAYGQPRFHLTFTPCSAQIYRYSLKTTSLFIESLSDHQQHVSNEQKCAY